MATKAEKTILAELLAETRGNRELRLEQSVILGRLDERTLAIQSHLKSTASGLHGRIDGVEDRFESRVKDVESRFSSRVNRRSAAVATVVAAIVGVVLTFAFNAMGLPRG